MSTRRIAVFTGTRAEYGLMSWIIRDLHESAEAELLLLAGGMHLAPEFGHTIDQIEADGIPVTERMEFVLSSDTAVGMSKSIGLATISAGEAFARHRPDLLVILGDRYEALAVAIAAMCARIPIAHIHGGESTQGLIDEAVRHSLTKLSHLHLTATSAYRDRVIQLGESPDRVLDVGAPGIDSIRRLALPSPEELTIELSFDLAPPYLLATYHPVTLTEDAAAAGLGHLLDALDQHPDHQVVLTYPNADAGGRRLITLLEEYGARWPGRVLLARSLGQRRYLGLMRHAAAVVGNSSSGLIEAPSFGVPTLDIGERQQGRIAGESVLRVADDRDSIRAGLATVLDPAFRAAHGSAPNPYGDGDSSRRIVEALLTVPLDGLVEKAFHDLPVLGGATVEVLA